MKVGAAREKTLSAFCLAHLFRYNVNMLDSSQEDPLVPVSLKKNAFGARIPDFPVLLSDPILAEHIRETLATIFSHLDVEKPSADKLSTAVLELAGSRDQADYERLGHQLLAHEELVDAFPEKLTGRAARVFEQIAPHVCGTKLFDYGCGDGKVGALFQRNGKEVLLADVYKHENVEQSGSSFLLLNQDERLELSDNAFDSTLLVTVLHHSDDPKGTLAEALRVTRSGGRVILIESVYGIEKAQHADADPFVAAFIRLSSEHQRRANMFFDHFYNRLVHYSDEEASKVNVPFNFQSPSGWKSLAESLGAKELHVEFLGVDQPMVPEYHTLHVLEVAER